MGLFQYSTLSQLPSVYFIINFKRGPATTRNTHSICQVAWILFFVGCILFLFFAFYSWLLAAFVITFCGFGCSFLYFFEINTCNLNISARRRRRLFLIANANYSYAALCSHNYRLLPHQIIGLRGPLCSLGSNANSNSNSKL